MKRYFSLDNRYNTLFSLIGETIKSYYPVGISNSEPGYHENAGIKKLQELMWEGMGVRNNFRNWTTYVNRVCMKLGKETASTTYGPRPCYSADLILERYEDEALIRTKKISFAVSLLGPYYSICGIDETTIKAFDDEMHKYFNAINVVTVSPFKEFEADFLFVEQQVTKRFKNYKFVPFQVCMSFIENVETLDSIADNGTVYSALFNHLFYFYTHNFSRGDRSY